ncbi:MAG: alanine--glyoxylate aminotransferase family protein [Armatimonadota bacterium]|nr:alanine--glyoxylate aminotransferase family protein [Armatimonadota bacterium]
MAAIGELKPPERILLGPGPSMVPPRVLQAMASPVLGHLDPAFLAIMDETMNLLRYVFQTENALTFPVSGTGSAGMEACLVNLLEPGDRAVIGVNGFFGQRMVEMARRCGADVTVVEAPWGQAVDPEEIRRALGQGKAKVVAVVHVETSTGVLQPLEEVVEVAHAYGAVTLVDAVASLGGVNLPVDKWGIDICYSGSQKCLSAPPGLSPVTVSDHIRQAVNGRKIPVQSWYLDFSLLKTYWGGERVYHHTAPVPMIYALHEALRIVQEEGLEARFARHATHAKALWAGLEGLGLRLFVPEPIRSPTLTTVEVPEGIDEAAVRRRLLSEYGIEIAGGLGPLRGRIWRIGLMGHSAQQRNVFLLLAALGTILHEMGVRVDPGAGVVAAREAYTS